MKRLDSTPKRVKREPVLGTDRSPARAISEDCLFFLLLLVPHFSRFPELNITAFPHGLWLWLQPLIPEPTYSLPTPTRLMVTSILMLAVCGYFFAHAWELRSSRPDAGPHRAKLALVLGAFVIVICVPALHEMSLRRIIGPETHAHDGVILVEEAVKKTLEGKNIYTEDFHGTPLERSAFANPQIWRRLGIEKYPALEHFVYLPLVVVITLPFQALAGWGIGWFDLRFILIPAYFVFIWLAYKLAKGPRQKIIAVQFAALNPFLATFLITGRNEALPLAFLLASLACIERHPRRGLFFLGLASLTKQYVWIIVPFFGLFLIRDKGVKGLLKNMWASTIALWPFWLVFTVGMLPYFIWDPAAFLKGVLLHSGAHPIKGIGAFGFGTWVLYFGWVKDAAGSFPFLLVQAIFTVPVLVFFFMRQIERNNMARLLTGSALTILVFFYFSRYFHDSYFGVVTALAALAYCVWEKEADDTAPERPKA